MLLIRKKLMSLGQGRQTVTAVRDARQHSAEGPDLVIIGTAWSKFPALKSCDSDAISILMQTVSARAKMT